MPEPLKEALQKVTTLVFQYTVRDGDLVIQAGILMERKQGTTGPGFGVPGAEDHSEESALAAWRRTHETGF